MNIQLKYNQYGQMRHCEDYIKMYTVDDTQLYKQNSQEQLSLK